MPARLRREALLWWSMRGEKRAGVLHRRSRKSNSTTDGSAEYPRPGRSPDRNHHQPRHVRFPRHVHFLFRAASSSARSFRHSPRPAEKHDRTFEGSFTGPLGFGEARTSPFGFGERDGGRSTGRSFSPKVYPARFTRRDRRLRNGDSGSLNGRCRGLKASISRGLRRAQVRGAVHGPWFCHRGSISKERSAARPAMELPACRGDGKALEAPR